MVLVPSPFSFPFLLSRALERPRRPPLTPPL